MASSSPPFGSLKYDVFLSFRGKDTRKTYVDFLYAFLTQRGIYAYKDDKTLPRGDAINPSLMKAIEESQIALVVFSTNYADSSWCLRELEHIMERWRKGDMIVMPIFFNVTTSDVKDPEGKFAQDISKLDSKHSSQIESWRKALIDATGIAGWEPKEMANGHQAVGIQEIVHIVSQGLKPLDSNAQKNLIGIESRMDDLKSMLKIGSDGVCMVGIWGIGGGGKTTLASSVYTDISSKFNAICLVESIREEEKRHGLKKLQKQILSAVLKKKIKVQSVKDGKDQIGGRFRHIEKVLLVLDDVDDIRQLQALAGSHDWFGPGSRIIITTRNEHLLNAHKVNATYNISLLNKVEADWLFRRHALRKCIHMEDYEEIDELSQEVTHYAHGLPLALEVLGLSLCDKDISEWRSALNRLKDIPEDDILKVLRISYDGLKPQQQDLFLDIACFFRQWPKDEAMVILDACGLHPVIGVKELKQRALITTSNERFDMHDLIHDMAHHIVHGAHPHNPENHSRIWRDEDIDNMCVRNETTENREILALHAPDYEAPPNLQKVVSNMKNLRSLYVHQKFTRTVQEPLYLSHMLRWISWKCYPASSLPANFQPRNLVSLILQNSLLKELWEGYKKFPVLKLLDVSSSKNLTTIPDLRGLEHLERLVLSGCSSLINMDSSIGYLEELVYLDLNGCDKLEMFPPIVNMCKLEILILSNCSRLQTFPEIHVPMDSLMHLNLDHSGIEVLPSSIGRYCTNLASISLTGCDHLINFECNFQLLKRRWLISVGGHGN
uniref:disease resistance protein Roq1-like n=1 Tax=Erigeron canadensis TaxID=72917 RepID=UPI001CB8D644|nr:disease resistance protein Roq1-like [Erigeron canadensis]